MSEISEYMPSSSSSTECFAIHNSIANDDIELTDHAKLIKEVEEDENRTAVIEDIETISIGTDDDPKEVKIGFTLTPSKDLIDTLKSYIDVFAWSYKDMPGIDREIAEHKIPIDPNACQREVKKDETRGYIKKKR